MRKQARVSGLALLGVVVAMSVAVMSVEAAPRKAPADVHPSGALARARVAVGEFANYISVKLAGVNQIIRLWDPTFYDFPETRMPRVKA